MDLGHTKATNPTQPLATARTLASPSEDVSALMSELFPTLDRPMTATSVRPVLGHCSSFTELLMYFEVSIFTRKLAGTLSFGACDAHRGQAQRRMHVSRDKITEHSARARAGRGGACAGKSGPDSACFLRPGATGALCGTAHAPRVHVALNEDNQCERNAIARKTLRRRPVRGEGGHPSTQASCLASPPS